ncbi:MAG: T9SS type A sorting domain-containing protein, partial [candidate division Zixibacteria bacterium]|nr:T9SS type A sorting domain-containing protein [candidate division Zixibacteria bacterium]
GTSGITTLTASAGPNTVNYSGAVQTVKATTYHHLTLSGSGAKTITNVSTINGNLTLAGTCSAAAAEDINIAGNLTVEPSATFATSSFTLDLKGNFDNNNIVIVSGGAITLTGTADQAIGGSATTIFGDLIINKAGGAVMVNTSFCVSGVLTLASGNINTGARVVTITSTGSVSRTSGHVVGNLRKQVSAGSPSQTFEIGFAGSYCPLTASFYGVTSSGDLTASVIAGDYPNIESSSIGSSQSVNCYWVLVNSGISFTNYDATFGFNTGDTDSGADASLFKVGQYAAGIWDYPVMGVRTASSSEATFLTGFGDFSLGEDRPDPPVLAAIDSLLVSEGDTLAVSVGATDPDGDSLILFVEALPANAAFSDNGNGTGTFNFNPSFTQAGVYNVTFIASDGSLADSELVAITVIDAGNQRPILADIDSQSVSEGDTLALEVSAIDADGDSLILTAEGLPANAGFIDNGDGTGRLNFSPDSTEAGVYSVTFIASDGALADSETVAITVNPPDSVTISGNAGVGGAILSYVDGISMSDTADGDGNYSLNIPYDWSGTVTPSKAGYDFTPSDRVYANVSANQANQDFAASLILEVGEDDNNPVPGEFCLAQNYPNPFNPTTTIEFSVPRRSQVVIDIYNQLGQTVRSLVDEEKTAGVYRITWDGTDTSGRPLSSGVYLYRITAGDFAQSKKMLLLK